MFPGGYNMPYMMPYGISGIPKSGGLFAKLAGLKSVNWGGLLNNASKTLGVINQAVPLVKQVGPMYNNMRSMLKVASLFKNETSPSVKTNNVSNKNNTNNRNNVNNNNNTRTNTNNNNVIEKEKTIINSNYSNSPNFFI